MQLNCMLFSIGINRIHLGMIMSIIFRYGSKTVFRLPIPNKASIIMLAFFIRFSVSFSFASLYTIVSYPDFLNAFSAISASPFNSVSSTLNKTFVLYPLFSNLLATEIPSPPLFPLPHITKISAW